MRFLRWAMLMVGLAAAGGAVLAQGEDDFFGGLRKESLRGVERITVQVAKPSEATLAAGLTPVRLYQRVTPELQEQGVRVVPRDKLAPLQTAGLMRVEVEVLPGKWDAEDGPLVAKMEVELFQACALVRDPEQLVYAPTWSREQWGVYRDAQQVEQEVARLARTCAEEWRGAQRRRADD
jgi:hypothetical protein